MTKCSMKVFLSLNSEKSGKIESPLQCTLVLSIAFFCVFSAYLSVQALQTSLNMEEGLGTKSLACVYAATIISSFLSPFCIKLLGGKLTVLVAFFVHIIYIGSNFHPKFYSLLPSSFMLGLVTGPLWTSQSMFLSASAKRISQQREKDLLNTLNKHNSIFFSMNGIALAIGGIVSSVILRNDIHLGGFNFTKPCGVYQCDSTTPKTNVSHNSTVTPSYSRHSEDSLYQLYAVYLTFDIIGVIIVALFLPPLPKSDWLQKKSPLKSLFSMFSLLSDAKMLLMLPYIIAVGIQRFFLYAEFSKAYITCPYGVGVVGLVMASYALTNTVIMQLLPKIMKLLNELLMVAMAYSINVVCMILWMLWNPAADQIPLVFVSAVSWGIADSIFRIDIYGTLPILFSDKKEPAFANLHFWQAIAFTLFFLTANYICIFTKLVICLSFLTFSVVLYGVLQNRVRRERRRSDVDISVIEKKALNQKYLDDFKDSSSRRSFSDKDVTEL